MKKFKVHTVRSIKAALPKVAPSSTGLTRFGYTGTSTQIPKIKGFNAK